MKPEVPWEETTGLETYMELLETAQVKVIDSEKIRGVDCYVLQLIPNIVQLWQLLIEQTEVTEVEIPAFAEVLTEAVLQEVFRSFSVKQWIVKDTYFLTKAEIDMAFELTPGVMGFPGEEGVMTMDLAVSLLAHSYNQPVSIVLPPEAKEAIETSWE